MVEKIDNINRTLKKNLGNDFCFLIFALTIVTPKYFSAQQITSNNSIENSILLQKVVNCGVDSQSIMTESYPIETEVSFYLPLQNVVQDDSFCIKLVGSCYIGSPPTHGHFGDVWVSGHYAYVALRWNTGGLRIFDVQNPNNPVLISTLLFPGYNNSWGIQDVQVVDTLAYAMSVCTGSYPGPYYTKFWIINVKNPTNPYIVSSLSLQSDNGWYSGPMAGLYVLNSYAYVANEEYGLAIINISNPSNPSLVGTFDLNRCMCVYVSSNYAYVGTNGVFSVVDVSNPSSPQEVSRLYGVDYQSDIFVLDSIAYLGRSSCYSIVNVANPSYPFAIHTEDLPGWWVFGIKAVANRIFLADGDYGTSYDGGITVQSTEILNAPVTTGYYFPPSARGIFVQDSLIYVADNRGYLLILQYYERPQIYVEPLSFEIILKPNETSIGTLILKNEGNLPLDWNVNENPPVNWLSENPTSGSVNPEDSTNVTITFNATGLSIGNYYDTLVVSSNDPNNPIIDIPVQMTVATQVENPKTVFVISTSRLNKFYPDSTDILKQKLNDFCYHPEVQGVVLDVDSSQTVLDAYTDWEAGDNWKLPEKANDVVKAIDDYLESKLTSLPTVNCIILVGNDRIIPFMRITDNSMYPEDYFVWEDSIINSATWHGYMLTSDCYADLEDMFDYSDFSIPYEYTVSRLIESPSQIINQIDIFTNYGGLITPASTFVSSGDYVPGLIFVADCADNIATRYKNLYGAQNVDDSLIQRDPFSPQYDKDNFKNHFLYSKHDICSVNNHTSHNSFYAPDKSWFSSYSIINNDTSMVRRIISTLGCHAGLNVYTEDTTAYTDLPEAFALKTIGAYMASTGYCISAWVFIGYSERIQVYFNTCMGEGNNTGDALLNAKHKYWLLREFWTPGDVMKTILTFQLYGLPFYHLSLPTVASSSKFISTILQQNDNTLILEPGPFVETLTPDSLGVYYSLPDSEFETSVGKPILPRITVPLINPSYEVVRLALIDYTYHETNPQQPAALNIISVGDSVFGEDFASDDWFPSQLYNISTLAFKDSLVQYLVITPAQYHQTTNTWRLYDRLEFAVVSIDSSVLAGDTIFVFPSPFVPNRGHTALTFANLPNEGTIEVYTIAGDLVWKHSFAQIGKLYSWNVKTDDGKNVASGVYIYLVKDNTDKVLKKGKFAIIR